ncbi:hypothetical protein AA15237_0745 [Komagataeibacter xylinus NBRC 15237]|nr:hypothetical protein AA15237_0745 [Komagataeibacter xylinus NBRC 15237]
MLSIPACALAGFFKGFRIMNGQSDSTPKPRKEPHEEWREALLRAWRSRRGYARPQDAAHTVSDEGFLYDDA